MPVHVFPAKEGAYVYKFSVADSDIDALGHANNVSFVRWINEAAIAHSTHVGFGIARCLRDELVWVVRRHDVEYLRPAFAGEQIEATTWPESWSGASSLRRTIFVRAGEVLARSETTWALLSTRDQRPRRVPEPMRAAYGLMADPP